MLRYLLRRPFIQLQDLLLKNENFSSRFQTKTFQFSLTNSKYFHTSPQRRIIVVSHENDYAFNVISKLKTKSIGNPHIYNHEVDNLEEFNKVLDQNWRGATASTIVETFKNVKKFCIQNNIDLSDKRFDKLVDGLLDNCEYLTVNELADLLSCIVEIPPTERYNSHNFHDLWSCLDDICCCSVVDWDVETSLEIAKFWYQLHLGRIADYPFTVVDRLSRKAERLTKNQLVNVFFCFNICRSRAVDFEYEYALEKLVQDMDVDELAIVSMGYFKTKTKIKIEPIKEAMVDKVIQNSEHIHEITLSAILKVLRLSNTSKLHLKVNEMLDKLTNEIPRLSTVCCLHIALLGTGSLLSLHPESLRKVSQKIVTNISDTEQIRLKDIERMLHALTMFDFDPQTTPDIFRECFIELHKESRLAEEIKYVRALIASLFYLSIKNIYSYELMDKVLDKDYIETNFGKNAKMLPRELLSLDCSIDIECPEYKGTRLDPNQRYRGAKWSTEFDPTVNYKKSQADELFLDLLKSIKEIVGEKCVSVKHIVPHFAKADIIVCKDKHTGKFVEPQGFEKYILGDVMFPLNVNNFEWYVFVIVNWSNTIRNTTQPLGQMLMKKRQLDKIGYNTVLVIWDQFTSMSPEARRSFILNKIKNNNFNKQN